MTRVAVFIDYQNTYEGAREAFDRRSHFTDGQIFPRRLGLLVTDRGRTVDAERRLEVVKSFRGEPSARHSAVGQAAMQRQVRFWDAQAAVQSVTRPLKYRPVGTDWNGDPRYEAQEKGIDVLIALHMVMGAMRDEYDVAVLMSADSDLAPAVEAVLDLGKRCEVAAWQGRSRQRRRLGVPGRNVWCHWLDHRDYAMVHDPTDYTRPQPTDPPAEP